MRLWMKGKAWLAMTPALAAMAGLAGFSELTSAIPAAAGEVSAQFGVDAPELARLGGYAVGTRRL